MDLCSCDGQSIVPSVVDLVMVTMMQRWSHSFGKGASISQIDPDTY